MTSALMLYEDSETERLHTNDDTETNAQRALLREGWIICDEGGGDWTAQPPSLQTVLKE